MVCRYNSSLYVVSDNKDTNFWKQFTTNKYSSWGLQKLFQTTKIQIFESNSQQWNCCRKPVLGCFRQQRYKFLKAIHNSLKCFLAIAPVVSDYKDTNFWKQFTTLLFTAVTLSWLFQTTKIQIFESNSQQSGTSKIEQHRCFRQQRYKFLKAIHNDDDKEVTLKSVVSDNKDTNFWKQFTTTTTRR